MDENTDYIDLSKMVEVNFKESEADENFNDIITNNTYKCPNCNYQTKGMSYMKRHVLEVHNKFKKYFCPYCSYKCSRRYTLKWHMVNVHRMLKPYQCPDCQYSTDDYQDLKNHTYMSHNRILTEDQIPLLSSVLDRSDKTEKPSDDGRKMNSCPFCSFVTVWPSSVKKHVRTTHLKEKPYKCSYCDYKASIRSAVHRHITSIHTNEKKFQCEKCDFKTARIDGLRNHIKNRHSIYSRNRNSVQEAN